MFRKSLAICISLVFAVSLTATGSETASHAKLSAAAIVEKNVAARGGLQAWRAVQTMLMQGRLGAGGNRRATIPVPIPDQESSRQALPTRPAEEVQLPFVMELKRPGKMRMELQFNGQTAIQVYDGANGWKLRPFLNRRVAEPYTTEEMKISSMQADVDGYLVDYVDKGIQIELVGMEKVEDRDTYKLKLTMKNGQAVHDWIDAQTFLEAKVEGQPRRLDGVSHPVEVYYRDYRPIGGLQIPHILETKVLQAARTAKGFKDPPVPAEKITIEKVVVNPKLDENHFSKPEIAVARNTK
jgi:hypothetical protein